jgi:hypothetical protein
MLAPRPSTIDWRGLVVILAIGLALGAARLNEPQATQAKSKVKDKAEAEVVEDIRSEVTILAVLVTPDKATVDPKLAGMAPLLRKSLPSLSERGFKFLSKESRELGLHQSVSCDLGGGYSATTEFVRGLEDAKIQLKFTLSREKKPRFESVVTTPLNQPFFLDKTLDDGRRVLFSVGTRQPR